MSVCGQRKYVNFAQIAEHVNISSKKILYSSVHVSPISFSKNDIILMEKSMLRRPVRPMATFYVRQHFACNFFYRARAYKNMTARYDIMSLIANFEIKNDLSSKLLIQWMIRFHCQVRLDEGYKTRSHVVLFR
jgi:hypothetical protein